MPVLILRTDGTVRDLAPDEPSDVVVLEAGRGDLRIQYDGKGGRALFRFMQAQEVPVGTVCDPKSPAEVRVGLDFPTPEAARAVLDFMLAYLSPDHVPGTVPKAIEGDPRFVREGAGYGFGDGTLGEPD